MVESDPFELIDDRGFGRPVVLGMSRNGEYLATAWENGRIESWSVEGKPTLQGHSTISVPSSKICNSNNGRFVAILSEDSEKEDSDELLVWDTTKGSTKSLSLTRSDRFRSISFIPNTISIVTQSAHLTVYDGNTGRVGPWPTPGRTSSIPIAFSSSGNCLMTYEDSRVPTFDRIAVDGEDSFFGELTYNHMLVIYSCCSREVIARSQIECDHVFLFSYLEVHNAWLVVDRRYGARLFDLTARCQIQSTLPDAQSVACVAGSLEAKKLVIARDNGAVEFWDALDLFRPPINFEVN